MYEHERRITQQFLYFQVHWEQDKMWEESDCCKYQINSHISIEPWQWPQTTRLRIYISSVWSPLVTSLEKLLTFSLPQPARYEHETQAVCAALAFTVQNINVCVSVGSSQLSGVWRPSLCHKRWCCWWWCGVWWLWIRRLVLRSQLHLWLGLQWPGDAVPDSCWSSLHLHLLRSCSHLWHPPGQVQQTNHHGDRWHLLLGSCSIVYLLYRRCTFVLCFLCCHGFCSRLLAARGAQVESILNILYLSCCVGWGLLLEKLCADLLLAQWLQKSLGEEFIWLQ